MRYICLILALYSTLYLHGQEVDSLRTARIEEKLKEVTSVDKRFNSQVDISVGKLSVSELLRNVAKASGVNLSIKGVADKVISCNFTQSRVNDLIFFLCGEYDLDIEVIGNIVSVYPVALPLQVKKEPDIKYNPSKGQLSYNLRHETISDVVKKITSLTSANIVIPESLYSVPISGFVSELPLNDAIIALAEINGLCADCDRKGVWSIYSDNKSSNNVGMVRSYRRSSTFSDNQLSVDSLGLITAKISSGRIADIVIDLCETLKLNYFFITPVDTETGIFVENVTFETLLDILFTGTEYSYYTDYNIYFLGHSPKDKEMLAVQVLPLHYRSVNKIDAIIPITLKAGLQISQFVDLNSLVISGNKSQISRVVSFVSSIDKPVPLITIDIIIVDSKKSNVMETGVGMGVGSAPTTTTGKISPGVDMTLGSSTINGLINSLNGFGSINMGKVTPEFYMTLKMMEANGDIEMQSTPKLSTLNGHQASLKSGETRYYKEVMNNYIGTQNPIQSESYTWKSIEANLDIKITPFVSLDNQITLDIEIEQSEFTAKEEKGAPPGIATRSFKSLIKVDNQEMVLLGGIDRNMREKSSEGLPFIARVPVLKWIFGQSKNNKTEHKLNVFIKPTVIQ